MIRHKHNSHHTNQSYVDKVVINHTHSALNTHNNSTEIGCVREIITCKDIPGANLKNRLETLESNPDNSFCQIHQIRNVIYEKTVNIKAKTIGMPCYVNTMFKCNGITSTTSPILLDTGAIFSAISHKFVERLRIQKLQLKVNA